jgi:hypothetical protein
MSLLDLSNLSLYSCPQLPSLVSQSFVNSCPRNRFRVVCLVDISCFVSLILRRICWGTLLFLQIVWRSTTGLAAYLNTMISGVILEKSFSPPFETVSNNNPYPRNPVSTQCSHLFGISKCDHRLSGYDFFRYSFDTTNVQVSS